MKRRGSDRDRWKLSHWDEYVKNVNFLPPQNFGDALIVYNGRNNGNGADGAGFESLIAEIKAVK